MQNLKKHELVQNMRVFHQFTEHEWATLRARSGKRTLRVMGTGPRTIKCTSRSLSDSQRTTNMFFPATSRIRIVIGFNSCIVGTTGFFKMTSSAPRSLLYPCWLSNPPRVLPMRPQQVSSNPVAPDRRSLVCPCWFMRITNSCYWIPGQGSTL